MKCVQCGYEVNRAMKYCPGCGLELQFPAAKGPRTEQFGASSVSLDVLYADFKVSFSNDDVVRFKIDGDDEVKDAVVFSLIDGHLSVEGVLPGITISRNIVSISMSNDTVTINGARLDKTMKLTIEMILPWNVKIDVKQYALGSMQFTNDAGDVILTNSGYMSINAQSFNILIATISGMADLTVQDIGSKLNATVTGRGDIVARTVKGVLDVSVYGNGDVQITRVSATTATFTIAGNGDVDILKGTIQSLTVTVNGSGDFEFGGHADTGSFTVSGRGDIDVDSCARILRRAISGRGDISIG